MGLVFGNEVIAIRVRVYILMSGVSVSGFRF